MAKHRASRGLIALSASAIATVYAVGYLHTQTADAAFAPVTVATVATAAPAASATTVPTATPGLVPPTQSVPVRPIVQPTPITAAVTATAGYKDGTYSGTGTSRFGDVTVDVSVVGGKITGVTMTKVTTKYPASRIASLPGQVVAQQTANVNGVSGATYSSSAFRTAVQQALSKAA